MYNTGTDKDPVYRSKKELDALFAGHVRHVQKAGGTGDEVIAYNKIFADYMPSIANNPQIKAMLADKNASGNDIRDAINKKYLEIPLDEKTF
ncbi:MAG: hypothetical protein Ta2B_10410 [Termitinemataceae bacterium]|nr:MAG: hypothetical protein Ta2B_10410 [Termitinemataceae bacterium]